MEKNLNISSRIENLRNVEKMIDEIASEFNIGSEIYGNILIATLEAANNAILHGNKLDSEKEVKIVFKIIEEELHIEINDEGEGFDYQHIPDPTAPENIENINGRGIFLMEKLSDKLEFSKNGSSIDLTFKL